MSNRILVAISEEDTENRVFNAAVDLADNLSEATGKGATLLFLHVIPDGKTDKLFAEESLHQRARVAKTLGIQATAEIAFGLPGRIICQYASPLKWNADYIVIGHRDRSVWQEFVLGSVSSYVTKHAPAGCEVEVVRPTSTVAS